MGKKKTNSLELSFSEEFDLKTSELYRAEQVGRQKTEESGPEVPLVGRPP